LRFQHYQLTAIGIYHANWIVVNKLEQINRGILPEWITVQPALQIRVVGLVKVERES